MIHLRGIWAINVIQVYLKYRLCFEIISYFLQFQQSEDLKLLETCDNLEIDWSIKKGLLIFTVWYVH